MGAVYRATDTKLNRDVAIKVLPDSFADDPERLARFQREAQVLASLNHPNIAAIYGVEDRAIVMELVEGPDLAGPLAVEEAPSLQNAYDFTAPGNGVITSMPFCRKGLTHRASCSVGSKCSNILSSLSETRMWGGPRS